MQVLTHRERVEMARPPQLCTFACLIQRGAFFFFDTETPELYEGDGEPPPEQVMKEPSPDSPLRLPPRGAGFSEL